MEKIIFYNSIEYWIFALGATVLTFTAIRIVGGIIYRRLHKLSQKTGTEIDDLIADMIRRIHTVVLLVLSLYVGSMFLTLPENVSKLLVKLIMISLLFQSGIWGNALILYWVEKYKKQKMEEDAASATTFTALGYVMRIVLWLVILLVVLDNLGVDITTLVAGLGVGGIAVALAVQSILGDLFASLSIVLDKPFVIGDFIIVDNSMGSVEHIGLKSTRIRSLSGEQLVISNSDLLKSRIRNFKRMNERRIIFSLGVTYQTPLEKLKQIPTILQEIIEKHEFVRFDRAHFKEYGNFSLNIEIVYWVTNSEFKVYMDIQQAINLEIYQRFQELGIEFAYPTQTVFIAQENGSKA